MNPPLDNPLAHRMARMIKAAGPISLAEYMHIAMADPAHGYYATRPAIGAKADFITAPEVSQMFGELIGIWCATSWQAIGAPNRFTLAEAGPGRGTLMADLLRAAASVPGFVNAANIVLIETSPAMRACQRQTLAAHAKRLAWTDRLETLGNAPLIVIANEFLDVFPMRQYVKSNGNWHERRIGLDKNGGFVSVLDGPLADTGILPIRHKAEPDGSAFEVSPAREAWAQMLAERLAAQGGSALLIDYGHSRHGFGDTFQAVRQHRSADPLADPGFADLTSHVDFEAVAAAARRGGALASPIVSQGDFLLEMGLSQRAGQLAKGKSAAQKQQIRIDADRLAHREKMGALFKVLALANDQNASAMILVPPFAMAGSVRHVPIQG